MSYSSTQTDVLRVAERFLAVRKMLGLTQQQFAESLSISLRSEQNYEKGERKISSRALLELARTHGIDPLWVLDGPGDKPRRIAAVRLDPRILAKAEQVVGEAVASSGRKLTSEQFHELVADAYQFLVVSDEAADPTAVLAAALKVSK